LSLATGRSGALRRNLFTHRHTILLAALVSTLIVRPLIGDAGIGPLVFSLALVGLMLVALWAIRIDERERPSPVRSAPARRWNVIAWTLAAAAVGERLTVIFDVNPALYVMGSLSWLAFFALVTWIELRGILAHREVTGETISMSISVYLLIGLTWGVLYIVLFQCQANAFSFGNAADLGVIADPSQQRHLVFPVLIYFSLTTLSTIGFGDITPLTLQARYAAVAEGITGQLYLAILVARLVGMHMSRPQE
jgi:hypothetical protein